MSSFPCFASRRSLPHHIPPLSELDAAREHQARNGAPPTLCRRLWMARTKARARRGPMHRAHVHGFLLHVIESPHPSAQCSALFIPPTNPREQQVDLLKHARIHRRCQPGPLLGGPCHKQLFPRHRSVCVHRGHSTASGRPRRRRALHAVGGYPGRV